MPGKEPGQDYPASIFRIFNFTGVSGEGVYMKHLSSLFGASRQVLKGSALVTFLALGGLSLTAQAGMITPSVVVQDQAVIDSRVVVLKVLSAAPGWIMIHADNGGNPGPALGYSPVRQGENLNVVVAIDSKKATPVLYAMLHVDSGVVGVLEFPGADVPVMNNGAMVSPAFKASAQDK